MSQVKNFFKNKLLLTLAVFSFTVTASYSSTFASKTYAQFPDLDDVPTIIDFVLQKSGKLLAKRMIDDIVQSTIKWANTGFDGNPAYITDPENFFRNTASGAIGDAINASDIGFLCSPFQADIKVSLLNTYKAREFQPQCTLEKIGVNIENFYQDFNQGGWEAWNKITQEDQNNPYGAYLGLKIRTDREIATVLEEKKEEKAQNSGFLSKTKCLVGNSPPPLSVRERWNDASAQDRKEIQSRYPNWDPNKGPGACVKEEIITPGSVIKEQLNKTLGTGVDKLVNADDINALASALLSGLLKRNVFNDRDGGGLFNSSSLASIQTEVIDIDKDGLPDGYDEDADGELDICNHGQKDLEAEPSNDNCLLSGNISNSPYFIPICKEIPETVKALEVFNDFITRNDFSPEYSVSWINRIMTANTTLDDLIRTISRYEVTEWDPVVFTLSKYSRYVGGRLSSLQLDSDLRFGGQSDLLELVKLRNNTTKILDYSRSIKDRIGQCDSPDIDAINSVPIPPLEGEDENNTSSTGSTNTPTTGPTETLSCTPTSNVATAGSTIGWSMVSTYPVGTNYTWSGDDFDGLITTASTPLYITYNTAGEKSMSITAVRADGVPVTAECNLTVSVTSPRNSGTNTPI